MITSYKPQDHTENGKNDNHLFEPPTPRWSPSLNQLSTPLSLRSSSLKDVQDDAKSQPFKDQAGKENLILRMQIFMKHVLSKP